MRAAGLRGLGFVGPTSSVLYFCDFAAATSWTDLPEWDVTFSSWLDVQLPVKRSYNPEVTHGRYSRMRQNDQLNPA